MLFLQVVVIVFCLILAGYGFMLGIKGVKIEERRDTNQRGLSMIVIGGGLIALSALIMTIAAKLLG